MIPSDLTFLNPGYAWLLGILLPMLFLFFLPRLKLPFVSKTHPPLFLLSLSFIFLVLALMNPVGNASYQDGIIALKKPLHVFLDTSASMQIADMPGNRSRLEYSKEFLKAFSRTPLSLTVFTSEVLPVVPETNDRNFFELMVTQTIINPEGTTGTDFKKALEKVSGKVLLISDGGDHSGFSTKKEELISIAVGSKEGLPYPLELDSLKSISEEVIIAGNRSPQALAGIMLQKFDSDGEIASQVTYDYYFQYPLFIAILAMILMLRGVRVLVWFLPATLISAPIGQNEYQAGMFSIAEELLLQEIETAPPSEKENLQLNLALVYLKQKKPRKALRILREVVSDVKHLKEEAYAQLGLLSLINDPILRSDALQVLKKKRTGKKHLDLRKKIDAHPTPELLLKLYSLELAKTDPLEKLVMEQKYYTLWKIYFGTYPEQIQPHKLARAYPKDVYILQLQKEDACQIAPWDQVFPLFYEGYAASKDESLNGQDLALEKWEEALEKFKLGSSGGGARTTESDLSQRVKEMQLEDVKPLPQRPLKEVEKPW